MERLYEVRLDPHRHKTTGNTRHHVGGSLWEGTAALRISQFPDDDGYYLLYLDEAGEEVTDTWHESAKAAMAQAEFEFGVKASDWDSFRASRGT